MRRASEKPAILQAGFIAYEQGLEPIKPRIEALNDQPAAVEFRVERGVVVGLPVGGTPVARNIGFDAAPRRPSYSSKGIKLL